MRLYIVQHGDALPEQVDPERPLSAEGRRDVEAVARLLASAGTRAVRVAHSGKLRAQQTAEVLTAALAPAAVPEIMTGLNPNDPVEPVGARRQPLLFEITTAGYDRHSICYEHHDYSSKVLESVLQDDSWFAFIAAADEGDDWTDPAVWRKANPNFGLSVKEDDLARKAEKAIALPGAQNAFRRMHLNEWTEQAERWIDMAAWDACDAPVDLDQLRGRPCFGGLDLSTTTDVTALAWVFPPDHDDDLWRVLSRYFVPADNLRKRAERDRVPYDLWSTQGFIEATEGNVVDYAAIERRIRGDSALFQVREIAYDPWNATHIALRLQEEGAAMVEFRQGFRSMAAPTRELEKLIVSCKLAHGGNPVTRWMAANVAVAQDPAGNLRPAKDKSTERIDGIVALIMAVGRAMLPSEQPVRSVYEDRGILVL